MDFDSKDRYRASAHYVWRLDPSDVLGEGAFGVVYRGFHKETCEYVAVKTFNKLTFKKPLATQMREMNILQKLNHPNVVKLIAIEDELTTARYKSNSANGNSLEGKALIMEYCTEGNLYSIIEQPENYFGLEESELLRVLSHTTSGMKYLRENKIVHRDWKPSNILKTVTDNGQISYKLCDFGAARELDDNQPFLSIVGTEEYIPPDIYGRALLGRGYGGESFSATSELWSFGVTLFHVATGQLPFKPFGGRTNRNTMYQIISEKPPGVISGLQESENGPINYSSGLPSHCRLSKQCNDFVAYLLRNLFETDREKMWSFDYFFEKVDEFLCKYRIRCLTPRFQCEWIYVDKFIGLKDFTRLIRQQFDVECERDDSILYYYDAHFLNDHFKLNKNAHLEQFALLNASKSPLLLIIADPNSEINDNIGLRTINDNNSIPGDGRLQFPINVKLCNDNCPNLAADYESATKCSALVFWALQMMKEKISCREICCKAANLFKSRLESTFKLLNERWNLLNKILLFQQSILVTLKNIMDETQVKKLNKNIQQTNSNLDALRISLDELKICLQKFVVPSFSESSNIVTALDRSVCSVFEITMQFRNDKVFYKHANESQQNELKWHGLMKKQLKDIWSRVVDQINADPLDGHLDQLHRYFSTASKLHSEMNLCDQGLTLVQEMVTALESSTKQIRLKENYADGCKNEIMTKGAEKSLNYEDLAAMVNDLRELREIATRSRDIIPKCNDLITNQSQEPDQF